jgi:hypothetical protein
VQASHASSAPDRPPARIGRPRGTSGSARALEEANSVPQVVQMKADIDANKHEKRGAGKASRLIRGRKSRRLGIV